jgi:hypothetical protein
LTSTNNFLGLNTEHENQQTTSNPFDYRKEERESSRFNMPQRATLYKAGLRKSGMFKSRQQSNERERKISSKQIAVRLYWHYIMAIKKYR